MNIINFTNEINENDCYNSVLLPPLGTPVDNNRAVRCVEETKHTMGYAVGALFVHDTLPLASKHNVNTSNVYVLSNKCYL